LKKKKTVWFLTDAHMFFTFDRANDKSWFCAFFQSKRKRK